MRKRQRVAAAQLYARSNRVDCCARYCCVCRFATYLPSHPSSLSPTHTLLLATQTRSVSLISPLYHLHHVVSVRSIPQRRLTDTSTTYSGQSSHGLRGLLTREAAGFFGRLSLLKGRSASQSLLSFTRVVLTVRLQT